MKRAVVLSIIVLFTLAVALPLAYSSSNAEAASSSSAAHRLHHHSKAWWKRYRARLRKRRADLASRRALEAQRMAQAKSQSSDQQQSIARIPSPIQFVAANGVYNDPRGSFSFTVPEGWTTRPATDSSDNRFYIFTPDGYPAGQATISVVGSPVAADSQVNLRSQRKSLGGQAFTDLRRIVIEKMITSNGWVVNDYEKEINGRKVFVVVAQTGAPNGGSTPQRTWMFHFVEIDGRVYDFATNAPIEFSDRISNGSEKVIASFSTGVKSALTASVER
jgi:hypothetical protein